jgi:hypothetical protein
MENQIDPDTLTVFTDAAAGQYVTIVTSQWIMLTARQ